MVYHNQLGSQAERITRLVEISAYIAQKINADAAQTQHAAELCKADLVTEMVGEFPELQGVMGHYYALNDGLDNTIALAIEVCPSHMIIPSAGAATRRCCITRGRPGSSR